LGSLGLIPFLFWRENGEGFKKGKGGFGFYNFLLWDRFLKVRNWEVISNGLPKFIFFPKRVPLIFRITFFGLKNSFLIFGC